MKLKTIFRNVKYFVPLLLKTNPMSIVSMVVCAVLNSISSFAWIIFPKMIIEELTLEKNVDKLVIIVLGFLISVFILRTLISLFNTIQDYYTQKASFVIEKKFNEKITSIDYFHVEDPKFADELSYAKKCLNQYSSGIYSITWAIRQFIENIITISGVIGIVLFSGEFLVIFIVVIGVFVNTHVYGKLQQVEAEFNETTTRYSRLQWYFSNSMMAFRNQKNLRLYNSQEMIEKHGDEVNSIVFDKQKQTTRKMNKLDTFNYLFYYFITTFGTIILLAYSAYKSNSVSVIATFTMLYSSVQTLDSCVSNLIYCLKSYKQDCIYQDNFINLMEIETVFKDGVLPIDKIENIEFKNVSFKYPRTDAYILENVSFKITDKEKVSLVGLNGSGKTTIIKLLCRFFEIEEGEILVNGININKYKYEDYMKQMAVVFQDFKIISFSIKSNICIDDYDEERLKDVLNRAEVLDKVESLPDKGNTYINKWFDKRGVEFSGGEMQKFALARALYKDADLIILDEPTSALDPMSEAKIYYHFNEVVGKKLTLFISHRLSSCIFSDRILVLDGSKIVESGSHKELMSNKEGLYYKMFNSQAEFYKD